MNDNYTDSGYLGDDTQANWKERAKRSVNKTLVAEAGSIRAMMRGSVRARDFAIAKIGATLELTMLVLTGRKHFLVEGKPD